MTAPRRAMREVVTGTAPSYWACYFINGDDSGMDSDEIAQADAFADWLGGCPVACTSEEDSDHPGFRWSHDAMRIAGTGAADCSLYSALIEFN